CLNRANVKGLFNSTTELAPDNAVSPKGTLWAEATCAEADPGDFIAFSSLFGQAIGDNIEGASLCLWLTNENFFYDVEFSIWDQGPASGFAYTRTAVTPDECGVDTATCNGGCGCPTGWINESGDGVCVLPDPCDTNPCGTGAVCRRTGATTHRCECDGVAFMRPPGEPSTVDCVTGTICLARGATRSIYNSLVDSPPTGGCDTFSGPALTQWSLSSCASSDAGDFGNFCNGSIPSTYVGTHACLATTDSGDPWDIQFTDWCAGDSGGCFTYLRWRAAADGEACD
ncbi:MAG: hypothetical protein WBG86_05820, partial [Polyangiales bacterium]